MSTKPSPQCLHPTLASTHNLLRGRGNFNVELISSHLITPNSLHILQEYIQPSSQMDNPHNGINMPVLTAGPATLPHKLLQTPRDTGTLHPRLRRRHFPYCAEHNTNRSRLRLQILSTIPTNCTLNRSPRDNSNRLAGISSTTSAPSLRLLTHIHNSLINHSLLYHHQTAPTCLLQEAPLPSTSPNSVQTCPQSSVTVVSTQPTLSTRTSCNSVLTIKPFPLLRAGLKQQTKPKKRAVPCLLHLSRPHNLPPLTQPSLPLVI